MRVGTLGGWLSLVTVQKPTEKKKRSFNSPREPYIYIYRVTEGTVRQHMRNCRRRMLKH